MPRTLTSRALPSARSVGHECPCRLAQGTASPSDSMDMCCTKHLAAPRLCIFPLRLGIPGIPFKPGAQTGSLASDLRAAPPVSPPSRSGPRFHRRQDLAPGSSVFKARHPCHVRGSRPSVRAAVPSAAVLDCPPPPPGCQSD